MRIWPFTRPQKPLPHVVFSRSKAAAKKAVETEHSRTDELIAACLHQGKPIPTYFRRSLDNQEGAK